MSAIATSVQHCSGGSIQCNKNKEKVKGSQIGKEGVKLSLFADDTILFVETPKEFTKKD